MIWSLGLGGAEQVVLRLAAGLDQTRFAPMICCLNAPGAFAERARQCGIEVVALHKRPGVDLIMLWRLARLMRARQIDIVHTHLWGANVWGRLAARLAGVRVVIAHEHGMQPWRTRWHFLADRWLGKGTDRILFASRQVRQGYLLRTGVVPARCVVIPNGVALDGDTGDRAALRRARGWSETDRVIISIGRLSPEKGYAELLQAFATVQRQLPEARLVLVGDGAEREVLEALQRTLGLHGHVMFAGTRQDVSAWLAAADVYVQPSRREGLPLAVLEAMAAGVPVVATRVGDLAGLITDGRDGYLVRPQDPRALTVTLLSVLRHLDAQRPVVDAARRMVERCHSIQHMVEAVERVYEDELSCRNRDEE